MLKRVFDFAVSLFGLLVFSPVLLVFSLLVFLQDYRTPLYMAPRVGRDGRLFRMTKLRSMIVGADLSGVDSTAQGDPRITFVGRIIRSYKLDELTQLWNVLIGDMSLVGPRPQVQRDVELYTKEEMGLLDVRPGITDFSSIVFSDEGAILAVYDDPDLAYNQRIRPWKSRLGLFYIMHQSFVLDLKLVYWTALSLVSREAALRGVVSVLTKLGAEVPLIEIGGRRKALVPHPPPGATQVVKSRSL